MFYLLINCNESLTFTKKCPILFYAEILSSSWNTLAAHRKVHGAVRTGNVHLHGSCEVCKWARALPQDIQGKNPSTQGRRFLYSSFGSATSQPAFYTYIASGLKTIHSSYSKLNQNELVSVCKVPCSHTHDNRLWNIKPEHWSAMLWRNGFECQDHSCLTDFSLIWFIYCLTCHVPANQLEAQPANYWAVPA